MAQFNGSSHLLNVKHALKCFVGLMPVGRVALHELYPPKEKRKQVKLMVGEAQLSALYMETICTPMKDINTYDTE